MERFYLLAPALLLFAVFSIGLVVFSALHAAGRIPAIRGVKHNLLFGPFLGRFLVWMLNPVERLLVGRVSANTVTAVSLLLCVITGAAAATGHLVIAVWTYALAGILDALDGRLARLSGEQTPAGALFDSVSDRWGELFMFSGYAWYLRDSAWLFAVLLAMGGSMMVSYTRARGEALGVNLSGGIMQRAERIVLVSAGTLIAAWYALNPETTAAVVPILGGTMLVCGLGSAATALSRWVVGYRELSRRTSARVEVAVTVESTLPPAAPPIGFPVPAKLRESAELGL